MSDSEKPLKIASFILSGLLIGSALVYSFFGQGEPVKAEVVVEYSAPAGLNPSELLASLETLRKDEAFLREVAVRSGLGNESEPEFAETVTQLARNLAFETNFGQSFIAIRFTHRKSATAVGVATAVATALKEKLEQQREALAHEILCLADAVEDKRKLLEHLRRYEAPEAGPPREDSESVRDARSFITIDGVNRDYESNLKRLAELKASRVISIAVIRATTLTGD